MGLARRAAAFQWLRSKVREVRCIDAQRLFCALPTPWEPSTCLTFPIPETFNNPRVYGGDRRSPPFPRGGLGAVPPAPLRQRDRAPFSLHETKTPNAG